MVKLPEHGIGVYYVTVGRDWLDYNEHMNVAFYLRAFDDAGEALSALAGMGADYTRATGNSWVALESHITFQQEAHLGDELRVESRVIDLDEKKIHIYQEMYRGEELLATHEQLGLHFDTGARRSSPFEPAVRRHFEALYTAQQQLPRPEWIGRAVALHRKKANA